MCESEEEGNSIDAIWCGNGQDVKNVKKATDRQMCGTLNGIQYLTYGLFFYKSK